MPGFGWRKSWARDTVQSTGAELGVRAARRLLEEKVEELGVKKRSYPISRELKLVALYRGTSVAVC
jgi:hypothetical protein